MTISDWINLIAAIIVGGGTLFLGIMAWLTIRQTRSIQKAEKRERLLNEIIEWAINVINWHSEHKKIFKAIVTTKSPEGQRLRVYTHVIEMRETFIGMRGRNEYIYKISLNLGLDLYKAVGKLIKSIEKNVEVLDSWRRAIAKDLAMAEDTNRVNKADESFQLMDELAFKVIETATKIKTEGTG